MKKKTLLAVLLVMTLLLSSCSLIVKDEAVDAATVILKMGDKEITKAEVQEAVQNELADMYQTYAYYGTQLDVSDPEVIQTARDRAVASLKQDMALRAKAAELGFDQLTEEETAKAKEDAQTNWETAKSYVKSYYLTEEQQALEGEELDKAIQEQLDAFGVTLEDYEKTAADQITDDKLREYAVKDVTVSDDEIREDYNSKVAADEEKYKEDAASWVTASNKGTSTLYYTPAGVRRVKQILIKFKEDDQTAIDDANSKITDANSRITAANSKITAAQEIIDNEEAAEEDKAQANEDLTAANTELETANADLEAAQAELKTATDTAFTNLDADADAVLEALKENPDSWDQLLEEKNEDPGMKAGAANAEKGYAVCEGMTGFDSAFVDAAMALKTVGDVSDKVRGETYGYYIIKYVGDDAEGAVDYDSVKDALHDALLSTKQDEAYTAAVQQWVDEAGIREDLNALKN